MSEPISNTSPLCYLQMAGALHLLPRIFRTIVIPQAVRDELEAGRRQGIGVPDPEELPWIRVRETQIDPAVARFELGHGESAVLSLARTVEDPLVILDDGPARRAARVLGLPSVGTLGILLVAKDLALLAEVQTIVSQLEALGFRMTPALKLAVLRRAGEVG